jgi:hypothetical protein
VGPICTAQGFKPGCVTSSAPGGPECSGSYESFFPVLWIAFLIYWQIKAVDTKTTRRLEPVASRILRVLIFLIAIVLLSIPLYQDLAFCTCRNSTTSGGTRPHPRKTSHEIACSARLGTSFKSALPGQANRKSYLEWSGGSR